MVALETIQLRMEYAKSYFQKLSELFNSNVNWEDSLNVNCWITRMAMIHPFFYGDVGKTPCPIRGKRSFDRIDYFPHDVCQSELLWGYKCPFGKQALEADHLFPHSMGGPTRSDNKVYLCKIHNQNCKGSDAHIYPWERGKPIWLDGLIEKIQQIRK